MRLMPRRLLRLAMAPVFLLPALLFAQTPATNTTTFSSSTDLVLIPTVVDKSGAHVPGLKKSDFILKQDGKSQPIAVFEEVKTTSERLHRFQGEHGIFSNFEPGSGEYHRLSIIVLDLLNTPFSDQANARTGLLKFLSEVANSGEPMCLLALTSGGLKMLHDFTDDPKVLAAALNKAKTNATANNYDPLVDPDHPTDGPLAATLTAMIRGSLESEAQLASLQTKVTASTTVQALQQIAKAFRGLPGRKSLIWASSGFPFSLSPYSSASSELYEPDLVVHNQDEMQSSYDNLWRMMNDAQIAIYSVDLRPANAGTFMSTGGVRPSDLGDPQFDTDALARDKNENTSTTLQTFAENTGGKAFLGGNNLVQSFRQAIQEDSSYYMLGYYVNAKNTRPGWHSVTVSVKMKGAHLRSRNSFLLSTETSATSARQEIQLALNSPLDFTGIPLSVTWTKREPAKDPAKTKVQFDLVMPANFASMDEYDQNHMIVDIVAVAKNEKGDVVADLSQRVDVHLKADGLEQIQSNGMTYRNGLQLPPGEYTVRFAVRDSLGNRTGSVAAPVVVGP